MKLEWSKDALADLDRFAAFLRQYYPSLSKIVAEEIIAKAQILAERPQLGHPIADLRPTAALLQTTASDAGPILSELDARTRENVLREIQGAEQVFLTSPEALPDVGGMCWTVRGGAVEEGGVPQA